MQVRSGWQNPVTYQAVSVWIFCVRQTCQVSGVCFRYDWRLLDAAGYQDRGYRRWRPAPVYDTPLLTHSDDLLNGIFVAIHFIDIFFFRQEELIFLRPAIPAYQRPAQIEVY